MNGNDTHSPCELPTPELITYIVREYHEPLRHSLLDLQVLAVHAAHDRRRPVPLLDRAASSATDLLDGALSYLDEYDRDVFPVLRGRLPATPAFRRTIARLQEHAHDVLRLVLRVQRAVSCLRRARDATAAQRELVASVDALAAKLYAQVELETSQLLPRVA